MTVRFEVRPELLTWARERSGLEEEDLLRRFPGLSEWQTAGGRRPTLRQLEQFATATHVPVGTLLLGEPPEEPLPIADLRTAPGQLRDRPSGDLLDTIYLCEQRQAWYRDFAMANDEEPIAYVASCEIGSPIEATAASIRRTLGFEVGERPRAETWTGALSALAERAESSGVLVMISGVVGSNTRRILEPEEFRGFALVDEYAPVVFVNGTDTKAAQIFTLAHELAHIWLGAAGVSNPSLIRQPDGQVERWCNGVAAELLVPMEQFRQTFAPTAELGTELDRLARLFKVSRLVVLTRAHEAGFLDREEYERAFERERHQALEMAARSSSGSPSSRGNFYNTQPVRTSKRFARAIIASTLEGQTLYRDAFHLLGFRKLSTFEGLRERLGVG